MEHVRVAFVTVPRDEAKTLAKAVIDERLAACVNIIPNIESYYWWDNEVRSDQEALLIFKTTQLKVEPLINFVKENHPYEIPEIITLGLSEGLPDYLNWVIEELGKEVR